MNCLLEHVLAGYTISPAMVNSVFIRFAKKRKFLNFDDFVFCMASLNLATSMCQVTLSMMSLLYCNFVSANFKKKKGRGELDLSYEKVNSYNS